MSANLTPCKDDLCRGGTLLLSNSLDFRPGDQKGNIEEVVAKGRVGGDVDILFLGIRNKLLARKDRVALDLVDSGNQAGLLDQSLEVLVCEVGNTYGANLALRQLVNSLPCLTVRHRVVNVDLISVCSGREEVRMGVLSRSEVDRPVDKVEIEVVKL